VRYRGSAHNKEGSSEEDRIHRDHARRHSLGIHRGSALFSHSSREDTTKDGRVDVRRREETLKCLLVGPPLVGSPFQRLEQTMVASMCLHSTSLTTAKEEGTEFKRVDTAAMATSTTATRRLVFFVSSCLVSYHLDR
jgi:hypothetical protein